VAELDTLPRFLPDEIGLGLVEFEFEGDSDRRPVASDGAGGTHDQRQWSRVASSARRSSDRVVNRRAVKSRPKGYSK
jgi:hypothetical protein